jgi:hypothetical protein
MCSRVPSGQFTLGRVILWFIENGSSCHRLLAVAAAFSRSRHFMPVRIIADRLVIHNNLEQQMPVFMRCSSSS